jgi:chemotaxis-related protein WspD
MPAPSDHEPHRDHFAERVSASGSVARSDATQPPGESALASERMRALLDRPLPPEAIRANTDLVAAPAATTEGATRSLLVFRIGAERLALEARDSHRVVPGSPVRRIPHRSNEVFAGIANIGGELTLVARLATALGIDAAPTRALPAAAGAPATSTAREASRRFVVIGGATTRWAFEVDAVEGVRRVGAARLLPPPATVRHAADGCTTHLVDLGDLPLVSLLDAERLSALLARSLS